MGRNGISKLILFFVVLILSSGVSNASFVSTIRHLAAPKDHDGNSSVKIQVNSLSVYFTFLFLFLSIREELI
jgi:hypothetical protein